MLPPPFPTTLRWRLLEGIVRMLEWLFFPQILMGLNSLVKRNTRPLTVREIALARSVFGENIDYQKVRMDERSHVACRRYRLAYVGFHYINCWGPLSDVHFIHEMVHVWQYQRLGAVYIPRALFAQRTPMGYNYGGPEALAHALRSGKTLLDFNYEQQGDVVADYFCLKNGLRPRWCAADRRLLPVFEAMLKTVGILDF